MTNTDAVKNLFNARGYAKASDLAALDYAIAIIMKLEAEGITDPLNFNFNQGKENSK